MLQLRLFGFQTTIYSTQCTRSLQQFEIQYIQYNVPSNGNMILIRQAIIENRITTYIHILWWPQTHFKWFPFSRFNCAKKTKDLFNLFKSITKLFKHLWNWMQMTRFLSRFSCDATFHWQHPREHALRILTCNHSLNRLWSELDEVKLIRFDLFEILVTQIDFRLRVSKRESEWVRSYHFL